MKTRTKLLSGIIALVLSAVLLFVSVIINGDIGMHYITIKKNTSNKLFLINEDDTVCSNIKEFTVQNTFVYGWIV